MNEPILGCIADDLTGATDLCNNLVRAGMRVVLTIDVPTEGGSLPADAIVVALKSRTIPAADAVAQSLHACRWLRGQGVRQIYFKVCSTFDSTPKGNIGPVIEALMDELGCDFSAVVPAFPDNERTVFRGHLFVGDVLLSDSGMRNHPLTPMTDANLVRFLQLQLGGEKQRKTGLIDYRSVARSGDAVRERIGKLRAEGVSIAVADSIGKDDLDRRPVPDLQLGCLHNGVSGPRRNLPSCLPREGAGLSFPAVARSRLMSKFFTSFKAEEMPALSIQPVWPKTATQRSGKFSSGRTHAGAAIRLSPCSYTRQHSLMQ
jgi:uncharacterized protein YgbK (DUF1537 family)